MKTQRYVNLSSYDLPRLRRRTYILIIMLCIATFSAFWYKFTNESEIALFLAFVAIINGFALKAHLELVTKVKKVFTMRS